MALIARGPRQRAQDDPLHVVRVAYPDEEQTARAEARRIVRRALVSYCLASLGALALVAVGAGAVASRVATEGAVRDAGFYTLKFAQLTVAPLVTDEFVAGDPTAIGRLDTIVKSQMAGDEVLRVKVWSQDARVLYSDEPRLIGRSYEIEPDDKVVLDELGLDVEVVEEDRLVAEPGPGREDLVRVLVEGHDDLSGGVVDDGVGHGGSPLLGAAGAAADVF